MIIYKEGDTITVELVVTKDYDNSQWSNLVSARYYQFPLSIPDKDIISHKPRLLQVGDIVRDTRLVCDHTYTIMAIHKEYAWVKPEINDKCFTVLLSKMERV